MNSRSGHGPRNIIAEYAKRGYQVYQRDVFPARGAIRVSKPEDVHRLAFRVGPSRPTLREYRGPRYTLNFSYRTGKPSLVEG